MKKALLTPLLSLGISALSLSAVPTGLLAQEVLPPDNGLTNYHTSPRYRESESHPFRVLAYIVHPIGWVAREVIFRPLSYFASSTEVTRSVMGYREPFDYRQPECFSADDSSPDCRSLAPFNYDGQVSEVAAVSEGSDGGIPVDSAVDATSIAARQVYFPDVNYDFDIKKLNDLGRGRAHQIAQLLSKEPGLKVVLQGHADAIGSDTYNDQLGMARADALREELLALGVPAERLSTVTFGETQPVFSGEEPWARAVNRRVEVHVTKDAG
jgi:outer membrane protein OmpA-like peptidoglycan-associated protein